MKHAILALSIFAAFGAQATVLVEPTKPRTPTAPSNNYNYNSNHVGNVVETSAGATASATGGSVVVGGVARSAPSVSGGAPSQPISSCRLGFTGGGSGMNGGGLLSFVLGNDETCLVGARLEAMRQAGGFSDEERMFIACKIEGMSELPACRAVNSLMGK